MNHSSHPAVKSRGRVLRLAFVALATVALLPLLGGCGSSCSSCPDGTYTTTSYHGGR
jgi:hypothetical protein